MLPISKIYKKYNYTKVSKIIITLIEMISYIAPILWSLNHGGSKNDYIMVLCFAIGITITFSQTSYTFYLFNYKVFNWLGKFSLSLYLGHGYWSHAFLGMFPEMPYKQSLAVYLIIAIITALFIQYFSELIRFLFSKNKNRIKNFFIKTNYSE